MVTVTAGVRQADCGGFVSWREVLEGGYGAW